MKCIKCKNDNNLKDRKASNGKCKSCGHRFTFDPKVGSQFTDTFFANTLNAISVNNTLYFTPRQFYYFFNVRKYKPNFNGYGCGALVLAFILFVFTGVMGIWSAGVFLFGPLFIVAIALFLAPVQSYLRKQMNRQAKANFAEVQGWLQRWMSHNSKVQKLLPPPQQQALPAAIKDEIKAYSFDRAIICDHAEIAHFLIANNFHFENNCAVLSADGYPQSIFLTVMDMLRRNPALKVYALHDASAAGVQLVHQLRTDLRWFANSQGVTIYDLGLLPRQVATRYMFVNKTGGMGHVPPEVLSTLLPDEIKWLSEGNSVELVSLAPMTLLKVLRNGIAKSRNPTEDDALVAVGDGGIYYSGSDVSVYSVDSFG